jgi:hypothetical protein
VTRRCEGEAGGLCECAFSRCDVAKYDVATCDVAKCDVAKYVVCDEWVRSEEALSCNAGDGRSWWCGEKGKE